jgi:protein-S-isoprenylcysteine O-methyltransferase Ste14
MDDKSRRVDIAMDMIAVLGWQVFPIIYVFSPCFDFADFILPAWVGWIGGVGLVLALWVLWQAYATLGKNWTPKIEVKNEQQLVTNGIFEYVRHPIYAGLLLWALIQPLLLQNWIVGFAFLIIFVPLLVLRVPREEAMMLLHFGEQYQAYMQRTPRFFPHFRL